MPPPRGTRGSYPGPRSRSPLPAATGVYAGFSAPGRASGGGGRAAPYSHPPGLSPPPAASAAPAAAAAGALCCNERGAAAAAEPARAPVAPVTATPPGAARRAAVHILSLAPSPARPRRRSPAKERRRLVAASPRSPDTPARRPGLGLQQEGGRLDSLVEVGEGLWLGVWPPVPSQGLL